jgi:hypothetical protein
MGNRRRRERHVHPSLRGCLRGSFPVLPRIASHSTKHEQSGLSTRKLQPAHKSNDTTGGKRRFAVTRRPRSAVVSRPDDPAGCRHVRGHRPSLWPGRAVATTRKSLLVSVVRRRYGHGLAFFRHYHERSWCPQTRIDAAQSGTSAEDAANIHDIRRKN